MRKMFALLIAVATLLTSCEYKDLCYHHPHTAALEIRVDWAQSLYERFDDGELPTGMTVVAYSRDGREPVVVSTNDIEQVTINLEAGVYDLMLFNQSFNEFGSLGFDGTEHYSEVRASSVASRVPWLVRALPEGVFSRTPEWLAVARIEGLEITKEMVAVRGRSTRVTLDYATAVIEDGILILRPHCAIERGELVVKVTDGYQSLASIRAVVQGFSLGYYLGLNRHTTATTGYQMANWVPTPDPIYRTKGQITSSFQLFGLPDGFAGRPEDVVVYLECLLVDGQTVKTFEFKVGDKVEEIYSDNNIDVQVNINIEVEISLPDVTPPGGSGSGGFAIEVEDWDEELLLNIPIG